MLALFVSKDPVGAWFIKNESNKLALVRPSKLIQKPQILHESDLCHTQKNEAVKVYLVAKPPIGMTQWTGETNNMTCDAFWALQAYGLKAIIIGVAESFDEHHKAERIYTHKLIGLMEGIFHLAGGIHAKGT